MNRYALYPGCNPQMAEPELLKATYAVAEVLGIELIKLDRVSCCGGAHLQDRNAFQSLLLNARNFTFAERLQMDLVTICNTCQYILAEAYHTLTTDTYTRKQINTRLEGENLTFQGTSRPRNFLYVLREDIDRTAVRQQVRRPLRGLKIAPFYGCHLYSPSMIQAVYTDNESPWNPGSLEDLISDLGGDPVDYPSRNQCCGFHSSLYNPRTSRDLVHQIIGQARENGARVLITPCPLCHANLEAFAPGKSIPILYYQQLMGLAFGLPWKSLGLQHNMSVRKRELLDLLPVVPEFLRR